MWTEIRTQVGYADMGKRYPAEVKMRLNDDHASDCKNEEGAWRPGEYEVDVLKSSYVSKYGSLALSEELFLLPVAAPAKLAAAK